MEQKDEQILTEMHGEFKSFLAKAAEETKLNGSAREETKAAIEAIKEKMDAIQKQTDAIDLKIVERHGEMLPPEAKSMGQIVTESEEFKSAKSTGFRVSQPIRAMMESAFSGRKSTITSVGIGSQATGVQPLMRLPDVTTIPMQALRIRDLLQVVTMTSGNSFDFVQMQSRQSSPSPQVEGSAKAESTYLWTSKSDTVKTIAHFTNISKQALDDVTWMRSTLDTELMYGLLLKEEAEILAGDGTGQHLKGLITQATAYNTALDVSGDTKIDKLRHAKLQCRLAGLATFAPDGVVLNPTDMAKIELIKDETGGANKGRYIIGDPVQGSAVKFIWGLPVVESDSITAGTFLMGAFGTGATLIDRMQAMVEISFEHSTNFTSNLATLLCEERIGLATRRPEAFVTGTI